MISHGWKSLGKHTFEAPGFSTAINEVATTIESPYYISCSGAQFAMISLVSTVGNQLNSIEIWGTQGSHEAGQKNKFYMSHKLVRIDQDAVPAVASTFPAGTLDEFVDAVNNYQIGLFTTEGNGLTSGPTLFGIFANLSGTRGLQVNAAANTGEINEPQYYYANLGDVIGPSWIAIPCGPFDYIQIRYFAGAASEVAALVNILE